MRSKARPVSYKPEDVIARAEQRIAQRKAEHGTSGQALDDVTLAPQSAHGNAKLNPASKRQRLARHLYERYATSTGARHLLWDQLPRMNPAEVEMSQTYWGAEADKVLNLLHRIDAKERNG